MKKIFALLSYIFFCCIICNGQSPNKIEDHILDTVRKLPEVSKRSKYVETKSKRHLQFAIWQKPNKQHNYYWVKVMEDNGMSYYTHFNLYIYQKGFLVKYLDTVNDRVLTLKQWRKSSDYPKE